MTETCETCAHWNDVPTEGTASRRCLQPRLITELVFVGKDEKEILPYKEAIFRPIRTAPHMHCPLWTKP